MKSKGHVYMANVMIACLKSAECQVTFPGNVKNEIYQISPYVKDCILRFPSCFRAGAVGPDFFPDLIFGQMTIHATRSGIWIDRMMDELKRLPANTQERQKAVSFFAGYMMHYAGDMFTHDYINGYALGWFPSYGEVIQNLFSFEIDWAEAEKDYSKLATQFKKQLPTKESFNKLKNKLPDFSKSLENFLSVEEEKRILENRYHELMEILGNLFSKETVQNDAGMISQEMRTFLERLYANPFAIDQLEENLPDLKQVLESFSGYQEIEKLSLFMPKLGQSLNEVFSFRTKRKRLETGYARLLESIENSFEQVEIRKWMKKEFSELWEGIKEFYKKYLLGNRLKGIEQAKIIARHVLVEKYMDDYIDEQIEATHRLEERTLEIPVDYVRRCFASEDAIKMLEKQEKTEEQKEDKIISILGYEIRPAKIGDTGFLENYLKYFAKLYEGEGTSDQNLDECNQKINSWLRIWKNIAEHSMQVGTFKAFDLYSKELLYHFVAFFTEQEEERRSLLNTIENIDTFLGVMDCDIPILSKLASEIKEGIKDSLKRQFYPDILDPASVLSKKPKEDLSDFDKAVAAVKERFQSVKPLLEDEFLFGDVARKIEKEKQNAAKTEDNTEEGKAEEGKTEDGKEDAKQEKTQTTVTDLDEDTWFKMITKKLLAIFGEAVLQTLDENKTGISDILREEWKNLGATDQLKDIEFEPFKNACLMGYLCLMEPEQLNKLMQNYVPDFQYYKSENNSIGIGSFIVSLKMQEKKYAKGIKSVRLEVHGADALLMSFRVGLTERCFHKDGEIRIPLPAKRTIPLEEVKQFKLILNDNAQKLEKPMDCTIYDGITNLLLVQKTMDANTVVMEMDGANVKDDFENTAHKAKINKLRVEIQTGDNGTDGTICFLIVKMNGDHQKAELDKSSYNDFEAGDLDSYEVELDVPLSIDEISHFEIYRDGGLDWIMEWVKVYSFEGGDLLAKFENKTLVDETHVFIPKVERWEAPSTSWHAPIQTSQLKIKKITITIKTSDITFSGTNDDVFFHVHYLSAAGEEVTEKIELDNSYHDDFENDQIDSYTYQFLGSVPIENFLYFEVKKEGKDDWVIDWIKVCDADTGKQIAAMEERHMIESDEGYVRINVK